jgi:hypothetical protein
MDNDGLNIMHRMLSSLFENKLSVMRLITEMSIDIPALAINTVELDLKILKKQVGGMIDN